MSNIKLSILGELHAEATAQYKSYKKSQDSILYLGGVIFIIIMVISVTLDLIDHKTIAANYQWYHVLILHTFFFIFYFLHSYKTICSEVYLAIALEVEYAIQNYLNLQSHQALHMNQLKTTMLSDHFNSIKPGLNLSKVVNILIAFAYLFATVGMYAIFKLDVAGGADIPSQVGVLAITMVFGAGFILAHRTINKKRKLTRQNVRRMIKARMENLVKASISYA